MSHSATFQESVIVSSLRLLMVARYGDFFFVCRLVLRPMAHSHLEQHHNFSSGRRYLLQLDRSIIIASIRYKFPDKGLPED